VHFVYSLNVRPWPLILASILWGSMTLAQAESQFRFDPAAARWSLSAPETSVQDARIGIDVDGKTLWPTRAVAVPGTKDAFELRFGDPRLSYTVRFRHWADQQEIQIDSTLRNGGDQPLRIGRVRLADLTGSTSRLGLGSNSVALVMSGWQEVSRAVRLVKAGPQVSKTLTELFDPDSRAALNVGFVTFDRAETDIEMNWNAVNKQVSLSAWCDLAGYTLKPGASIDAETLRVAISRDPYASLEQWADRVQARYHPPIPPTNPAGWVGWTWVDPFNVEWYEDVVRRNAEAIRRRLPGLDIDYIWVSIGNLEDRFAGNWLKWNYKNFPSGPERLVADIGAQDFKLGLWAGAFWVNENAKSVVDRLRDALLLYQGKPAVVDGGMLGKMYMPDPTHPKTQDFLREVFSTYRKWGVRWYMIDFVYAVTGATPGKVPNDGYYDRSLTRGPQAWREGLRAIREAAGDDTYLLMSTGPTFQSVGLMNAVRTGNDHGEGRPLDGPGKGFYPATFVINRPNHWTSHRRCTDAFAAQYYAHRKVFLGDSANVMSVDQPIPLSDAQLTATIFGINGGPIMLGDDIARMSDDRLEMVKQVFPRLTETARPLDLFESVEPDYPKLFHLKVSRDWETWDLIACLNYGATTLHREVDLGHLGLDATAAYVAWDYWDQRYLGTQRRVLSFDVPPFSVRLLRIARQQDHPWLLSTDMHVRQGQAEIQDCRWNAETGTLTIRAQRPKGYKGNLFLYAPKGWALAEPAGLWIAKDGNDESLIVRKALEFSDQPSEIRVAFKRLPATK